MNDINVVNTQTVAKPASIALFGGAIAASVTEANATVIDMTKFNAGTLDFKINSGAGTFAVAVYGSDVPTGVFKPLYKQILSDGTFTALSITTVTTVSAEYVIGGLLPKYIKFVPTLTNTANATFTFTPAVM